MKPFLALLLALAAFGCTKGGTTKSVGPAAGASLCAASGAVLDPVRNECVCEGGQRWTGSACEAPLDTNGPGPIEPPTVPMARSLPPTPAPMPAHAAKVTPPSQPKLAQATPPPPPPPAEPAVEDPFESTLEEAAAPEVAPATADDPMAAAFGERLRGDCRAAGGTWIAADGHCLCERGRILIGRRCVEAPGEVTRGICLRAASPGKWLRGACHCDDPGAVFSPGRGGCVPMRLLGEATQRRICESSLNRGKWDARDARCVCPAGRVWTSEACAPQRDLSSERVCESDFNQGRWDKTRKSCHCPTGKLWIDQTCRSVSAVDARVACEAEVNKGTWSIAGNKCQCPRRTSWNAAAKVCR